LLDWAIIVKKYNIFMVAFLENRVNNKSTVYQSSRCDSVNNPCNLRYPFNLRFRQMAHVAPLGLWGMGVSVFYKHVAPLGLNAPCPFLK
jgi:hypothetical protein